jgi:hypothetical protein
MHMAFNTMVHTPPVVGNLGKAPRPHIQSKAMDIYVPKSKLNMQVMQCGLRLDHITSIISGHSISNLFISCYSMTQYPNKILNLRTYPTTLVYACGEPVAENYVVSNV